MDLTSRLRSILKHPGTAGRPTDSPSTPLQGLRELTYEPDDGYRQPAPLDLDQVTCALGGRRIATRFGDCLVIDRRYESDRWHGDVQIGECDIAAVDGLRLLDPALAVDSSAPPPRTIFIDLETTGLSGGAGTLAFLVGCGYFDLGAFQVRQFLLTSHSGERALLAAVAEFFDGADLIVTYNGKTFDLPVMETRWAFHRIRMPLDEVPHFDMLHTARRLWKARERARAAGASPEWTAVDGGRDDDGCRLAALERRLFDVKRVGDVPGSDIPSRFYRFVRSGDPRPLEPVLEHNRIDLVSLAAVTARAVRLAQLGHDGCGTNAEALALGRIYERAQAFSRAEACYRRATRSSNPLTKGEALYRLAIRLRRTRRFVEAAAEWRALKELTDARSMRRGMLGDLRQVAVEALAIHHEHREKDLAGARELALNALEELGGDSADVRHRLSRIERKLMRTPPQLFPH